MSQEKVDFHKKEKANRKATVKKAKIQRVVATIVAALVCIAVLVWVGISTVNKIQEVNAANKVWEKNEISLTPIDNYLVDVTGSSSESAE